jgi:deazaflavin-dependent oxidoreductase (nitroreductase family)
MKFHPPNKRFSEFYRRVLYRFIGGKVLLLTTTGRKSGKAHTIGLQYELIDGRYFVGAADGEGADWVKNLWKTPTAVIQAGSVVLPVTAEIVADLERIADFLEYRVRKHPLMIPLIMRLDGFKGRFTRESLRAYSGRLRLVILTPSTTSRES